MDYIEINKPYIDSPILAFLITQMDAIINLATSAPFNFKIALEVCRGGSKVDPTSIHATDFIDLFKYVASHYRENKSLIGYSTASEPEFSELFYIPKTQICDITSQWYDAIKSSDVDPNHLITTHGDITDVLFWDPAIIKCDYYEIHPYPAPTPYEKNTSGYDVGQASMDRLRSKMYWYRNYCPKPIMIGETGFRAADFSTYQEYNQDPTFYDGTLTQQHDYAEQTLQSLIDCNGMGYNWWNFQDDWNWIEVGFGLIHHGAIPSTLPNKYDKPVAAVFKTLPTPNICSKPSNYLDPFNHGGTPFNPNHINAITGRLVDENGNGIPGGIVQALNYLGKERDNNGVFADVYNWLYFYTEDDPNSANEIGHFEVIPFNSNPIFDPIIPYIRGSASGAEKFEEGPAWTSTGWRPIQLQPPDLGNITLKKINFEYAGIFNNLTITEGVIKNYLTSWNDVSVSNTTIAGTSDISARHEINVINEFHAKKNSEVHIYTSETNAECSLLTNFKRIPNNFSTDDIRNDIKFEIVFSKNLKPDFLIQPNPSDGFFNIEIKNFNNTLANISIKSLLGVNLKLFSTSEPTKSINLNDFAKGIYFIEVSINKQKTIKKLIIN